MKIQIPYRTYKKDQSFWLNFVVAAHVLILIITLCCVNIYLAVVTICSLTFLIVAWIKDFFPTDRVELNFRNSQLHVKQRKKNLKVLDRHFFWSNIFTVIGDGNTVLRNDQTHIINIQLNLCLHLENGQKILIKNRLFQWQSSPHDWEYDHFDPEDYDLICVTHYDLKKLKQKIELHRN